jgi:hypothetical protein
MDYGSIATQIPESAAFPAIPLFLAFVPGFFLILPRKI